MKRLALFFCLIVLPVYSWAQQSVGSADYSVDGTTFYFDVVLNNVSTGSSVIFRIADPDLAFSGSNFERLAVNFETTSGGITSEGSQEFGTPVNDRWPTGSITNLTVAANGALSWRVFGSIPHGSDPFVIGDTIRDTVIRHGGLDIRVLDTPITGAAPPPATYTVSGAVSGLTGSVTLQNNGGDDIIQTTNVGFTFPAQAQGTDYAVIVSSQPAGQTCTVGNGSGTNITADITNVTVTCADDVTPLIAGPATPVPTMSVWALGMLISLMGLIGFHRRRKV